MRAATPARATRQAKRQYVGVAGSTQRRPRDRGKKQQPRTSNTVQRGERQHSQRKAWVARQGPVPRRRWNARRRSDASARAGGKCGATARNATRGPRAFQTEARGMSSLSNSYMPRAGCVCVAKAARCGEARGSGAPKIQTRGARSNAGAARQSQAKEN